MTTTDLESYEIDLRVATQPVRSVSIVHDYLTQRGGAERVVLALARAFPDAAVHTSLYEPESTFPEFGAIDVRPSVLNRSAFLRGHHRVALPLYAPVFSRTAVEADVTICSTSGWAHGVECSGRKLLYVHNPARWLYQTDDYVGSERPVLRRIMRAVRPRLVRWDRRAAGSADGMIANSLLVRDRIRRVWGHHAPVVYPAHGAQPGGPEEPIEGIDEGFLLVVARLASYKRIDAILDAMRQLPDERLVVVGGGPDHQRLAARCPANARLLGTVSDAHLRWLYRRASLFLAAAKEDLGLAPVEAMSFGTPVVVLRGGGFLETVDEGETGTFFDHAEPKLIVDAVRRARQERWELNRLIRSADRFSEAAFTRSLRSAVAALD